MNSDIKLCKVSTFLSNSVRAIKADSLWRVNIARISRTSTCLKSVVDSSYYQQDVTWLNPSNTLIPADKEVLGLSRTRLYLSNHWWNTVPREQCDTWVLPYRPFSNITRLLSITFANILTLLACTQSADNVFHTYIIYIIRCFRRVNPF